MHRSVVQPFLKQSTRFSAPHISSVSFRGGTTQSTSPSSITRKISSLIITRSSSAASSSFDDYDQIMRTTTQSASSSSFSSSAGGNNSFPSTASSTTPYATTYHSSSSTSSDDDDIAPSSKTQAYYQSIDHEPTVHEDYDTYELHHPPCEKTKESYYDASFGLGLGWWRFSIILDRKKRLERTSICCN